MDSSLLTPLQQAILVGFFAGGAALFGFFLTGGTALAEFYLRHRESVDLDLGGRPVTVAPAAPVIAQTSCTGAGAWRRDAEP